MQLLPQVQGMIERRILINYRADSALISPILPAPLRPKLVRGVAIVGICLIRLAQVRPRWVPRLLGVSSENAAHRIAVEWDAADGPREGVYSCAPAGG